MRREDMLVLRTCHMNDPFTHPSPGSQKIFPEEGLGQQLNCLPKDAFKRRIFYSYRRWTVACITFCLNCDFNRWVTKKFSLFNRREWAISVHPESVAARRLCFHVWLYWWREGERSSSFFARWYRSRGHCCK